MKSIKETHPSLKFSERQGEFDITSKGFSCWTMERFLEDIQKYTIDKAVLRDKIKEWHDIIGGKYDFESVKMDEDQLYDVVNLLANMLELEEK